MRDEHRICRGFSVIELLIAIAVMSIIVAVAMLILGLGPTKAGNEAAAIATLRSLVTAERVYSSTTGRGSFGDLGELQAANLIDPKLAAGTRSGYTFQISKQNDAFTITANPISDRTGTRSFFADDSGVIRVRTGTGANAGDPPIGG